MIETIKHFLGICGEPHLNIFTIVFLILLLLSVKYKAIKNE